MACDTILTPLVFMCFFNVLWYGIDTFSFFVCFYCGFVIVSLYLREGYFWHFFSTCELRMVRWEGDIKYVSSESKVILYIYIYIYIDRQRERERDSIKKCVGNIKYKSACVGNAVIDSVNSGTIVCMWLYNYLMIASFCIKNNGFVFLFLLLVC